MNNFLLNSFLIFLVTFSINIKATPIELVRLQDSYPDLIQEVNPNYIAWKDGTQLTIRGGSSFFNKVASLFSSSSKIKTDISIKDLRCDSYEPLFRKMYGNSATEVRKKLVTVYWMPKVFGYRYPLKITTVNGVDKKIQRISAELEKLPQSYFKYLANPAGSFYWRNVAKEKYLSAHSFGIALDINSHFTNYWMWDWVKSKKRLPDLKNHHNNIPMEIVQIFENEGFLWGGRWYFYDTMHFEYRPELFMKTTGTDNQYNNQLGLRCPA